MLGEVSPGRGANRVLLTGCRLIDPEGIHSQAASVLVKDGRIEAVLEPGASGPDGVPRTDLGGRFLTPGFIDIHHHGELIYAAPAMLPAALERTSRALLAGGTTAFLPTTVAAGPEHLDAIMTQFEGVMTHSAWSGAEPLGVHLEGPWINDAAAGAQPGAAIRPFDPTRDLQLIERYKEVISMVTCAPECEGVELLLGALLRHGAVAALGHSLASPERIDASIERGMTHVTHLFNAMGPLHHRAPSVPGHVLAEPRLSCDLICDGVHVHPDMVVLAASVLGERLVLITDQIAVPDGPGPDFGAGAVHDDGRAIRLADGRLAGSSLTLDRAVRCATEFRALTFEAAIAAVTLRPAKLLGVEAERGTFRVGARADFAVLDADAHVAQTWIAGERIV